ncbi:uncharacterized protein LOC107274490 isoform X2 [Cephus cinctus]|uniref:Uncharacterized protein LOC107274490 isoform X2 n=1 Tax=Cephus cinctus TaxID=211228 RepID=A0AAJ7CEX1_CEPCN|nr:uncharacterized protein LOC107274490 isoform X2 [Cephus cinctus]
MRQLLELILLVLLTGGQAEPCSEYGCPHRPHHEPFVPAPPGHTPRCAKPGQTFCETLDHYPQQLIRFLIDKWNFDYNRVLIDESRDDFNSYRSDRTRLPGGLRVPQTGNIPVLSSTPTVPTTPLPLWRTTSFGLWPTPEYNPSARLQLSSAPANTGESFSPAASANGNLSGPSASSSSAATSASASSQSFPLPSVPDLGILGPGSGLVVEQVRSWERRGRSAAFSTGEPPFGIRKIKEGSHEAASELSGHRTLSNKLAIHNAEGRLEQQGQLDVRGESAGTGQQVHPAGAKRDLRGRHLQRLVLLANRLHE